MLRGSLAGCLLGFLLLACGGQSAKGEDSHGSSDDQYPPIVDCWYDGKLHPAFESFPGMEPCTTCSCIHGGGVLCSPTACPTCERAITDYGKALDDAKACHQDDPEACSQRVSAGLACSCDTFVNPALAAALEQARAVQRTYADNACGADVKCGPCQRPESGWCNRISRCVDRFPVARGAACQVAGATYASGSTDVPSVEDCNRCTCTDGVLGNCTLIACSTHPCPQGTRSADSCVECGPDGCSTVEYSCRPTCTDRCDDGVCQQGVCRRACEL